MKRITRKPYLLAGSNKSIVNKIAPSGWHKQTNKIILWTADCYRKYVTKMRNIHDYWMEWNCLLFYWWCHAVKEGKKLLHEIDRQIELGISKFIANSISIVSFDAFVWFRWCMVFLWKIHFWIGWDQFLLAMLVRWLLSEIKAVALIFFITRWIKRVTVTARWNHMKCGWN